MGEALDTLHLIDAKQLHPRYYAGSLIQQALSCCLLSETDVSKIQSDLLVILAEQCDKWGYGESSSIPTEKAQDMMTSILFVISIKLKSCRSPEQAVKMLKSEPMKSLFESGLQMLRRKIAAAGHLQKRIADNLFDTPNVYYRSTIVDGINGFFKLYRPQFSAHEIHITADYPVLMGRPESDGIEFIEQYLRCIEAENAFCVQFCSQDIHRLLCGLTQDYRRVPMNLFEYVMLSALGLALLNCNPQKLNLSKEDVEKLYCIFLDKADEEIAGYLDKAVISLSEYDLLPKSTERYLAVTLQRFVSDISNAVKTETLDKIFLVPVCPEQEIKISFDYGEQMDNRKYQKLVDKILQADSSDEKISLILNEVHSLADLLDILCDTELYEEDYELLISKLPLSVFVVLLSKYPNDDFLDRENEQLLYQALSRRNQRLSSEERHQVEQALEALQKDDFIIPEIFLKKFGKTY
ncbi:MAG: DUF6179 domain-containing protein [Oscillospiraceae bacterium]